MLWEVPLAAFCSVAGDGLADWLQVTGPALFAFVSVITYLSSGGIEAIV